MPNPGLQPPHAASVPSALHTSIRAVAESANRPHLRGSEVAADRGHIPGWHLHEHYDAQPSDRSFVAMLAAYRGSGGIASLETLACLARGRSGSGTSALNQVTSGAAFSFYWSDVSWVPMFQFDRHDQALLPAPQQVLAALADVFDGWALTTWFSQTRSWLHDERLLDLLDSKLALVLTAARVNRFIANG